MAFNRVEQTRGLGVSCYAPAPALGFVVASMPDCLLAWIQQFFDHAHRVHSAGQLRQRHQPEPERLIRREPANQSQRRTLGEIVSVSHANKFDICSHTALRSGIRPSVRTQATCQRYRCAPAQKLR